MGLAVRSASHSLSLDQFIVHKPVTLSDAICLGCSLMAGFMSAYAITGMAPCVLPLSKGRFVFGAALAAIVPFLASMHSPAGSPGLRRWLAQAAAFALPSALPVYIGLMGHEWSKVVAAAATWLIAVASAYGADRASRRN